MCHRAHLRVANEREIQEDDIVLSHGKVVLHGGVLQSDVKVLSHHPALADRKVVQRRLAEAVAKAVEGSCSQVSASDAALLPDCTCLTCASADS